MKLKGQLYELRIGGATPAPSTPICHTSNVVAAKTPGSIRRGRNKGTPSKPKQLLHEVMIALDNEDEVSDKLRLILLLEIPWVAFVHFLYIFIPGNH